MPKSTRPSIPMPLYPPGYRGATQIPEWVWALLEERPEASEAWGRLVGVAHDEEPDDEAFWQAWRAFHARQKR